MKRLNLFFLFPFLLACLSLPEVVLAQINSPMLQLKGQIMSKENEPATPLSDATVQLISLPDSTFATGGISNKEGKFDLYYIKNRTTPRYFLLKVSYLGMEEYQRELRAEVKDRVIDAGTITLAPKAMTLQEAQIVGKLKKMYMRGDTLIYNTDAFKMPRGSVLLELIRRLPGLYFDQNGTLMYLDKPINDIRLNGEEFFAHDMNIALKNVPVKELEQVKVYETVTEEDKMRGSDVKKPVLDMKTKKDVDKTVLANLTVGGANRDKRYLLDGSLNFYKKKGAQISLSGYAHNLPGNYSPERPDGLSSSSYMIDRNTSKEKTVKKLQLYWKQNLKRWQFTERLSHDYENDLTESASSSESYLSSSSLFSESQRYGSNRKTGISSSTNLSKMMKGATLMFMGRAANTHGESVSRSTSASFHTNPYDYTEHPLETDEEELASIYTNRMQQQSVGRSHRKNMNASLLFNKHKRGSGYFLYIAASYMENQSSSLTQSRTRFFQVDSIADQFQYTRTPSRSFSVSGGGKYSRSHGMGKGFDFTYRIDYAEESRDRFVYDLNQLSDDMEWNVLPEEYPSVLVDSISRQADTRSVNHQFNARYSGALGESFDYLVDVNFLPKHIHATTRTTQQEIADMGYTFYNWRIRADMEYKAGRSEYTLSYNLYTSEPSVDNLLPITNNDDPLNISSGNPDLKSAVNQRVELLFKNGYAWNARLSYLRRDKLVAYKVVYDELTGARSSMPANISGNWETTAWIDYKNAWKDFTLNCNINYGYSNRVRYVQNALALAENTDEKGTIRQQTGTLKADFRYAPKMLEAGIVLQCDLDHTRNELASTKLFTKDYSVSGIFKAFLPSDIELGTSFAYRLRRGYNFTSANLNEGVWNISASYKFLRERTATIKLECFDLLKQKKNITYTSNGYGNGETRVNCINRYVLLTFSYRFNVFN